MEDLTDTLIRYTVNANDADWGSEPRKAPSRPKTRRSPESSPDPDAGRPTFDIPGYNPNKKLVLKFLRVEGKLGYLEFTDDIQTKLALRRGQIDGKSEVYLTTKMPSTNDENSSASVLFVDGMGNLEVKYEVKWEGELRLMTIFLEFESLRIESLVAKDHRTLKRDEYRFFDAMQDIARQRENNRYKVTLKIFAPRNDEKAKSMLFLDQFHHRSPVCAASLPPLLFDHHSQAATYWKRIYKLNYEKTKQIWQRFNQTDLHARFERLYVDFYRVKLRSAKPKVAIYDSDVGPELQSGFKFLLKWGRNFQAEGTVSDEDIFVVNNNKDVILSMLVHIPEEDFPGDEARRLYSIQIKNNKTSYLRIKRMFDTMAKIIEGTSETLDRAEDMEGEISVPMVEDSPAPRYERAEVAKIFEIIIYGRPVEEVSIQPHTASIRDAYLMTASSRMNDSQRDAVKSVLKHNLTLVQGPPGTGKSETLLRTVHTFFWEALKSGKRTRDVYPGRVLVAAPSNQAVDQLLGRFLKIAEHHTTLLGRLDIVRYTAANQESNYLCTTTDILNFDSGTLAGDSPRGTHEEYPREIGIHHKRCALDPYYEEEFERYLIGNLDEDEEKLFLRKRADLDSEILNHADILFTTCHGAGSDTVRLMYKPTLVLVDECGQADEPESLLPICMESVRQVGYFGDLYQLPPLHTNGIRALAMSLFEKLEKYRHDGQHFYANKVMLNVNYRNAQPIVDFVSSKWYSNCLQSTSNRLRVEGTKKYNELCKELFGFASSIVWIDCKGNEDMDAKGSKFNVENAYAVQNLIAKCLKYGGPSFGIIAMYSAQVSQIKKTLNVVDPGRKVQVGTVEGFQGLERDIILLDLVRKNERGNVGFLSQTKRLNVAITRAKFGLFIIGDWNFYANSDMFGNVKVPELYSLADLNRSHVVRLAQNGFERRKMQTGCSYRGSEGHIC